MVRITGGHDVKIGDKVYVNGRKFKIIHIKFNTTFNEYRFKLHAMDKTNEVLYNADEKWFKVEGGQNKWFIKKD